MTSKEFEDACENAISGRLWDNTFNKLYQESLTLAVCEMREIVNVLRAKEGLPARSVFDPFEAGGAS